MPFLWGIQRNRIVYLSKSSPLFLKACLIPDIALHMWVGQPDIIIWIEITKIQSPSHVELDIDGFTCLFEPGRLDEPLNQTPQFSDEDTEGKNLPNSTK